MKKTAMIVILAALFVPAACSKKATPPAQPGTPATPAAPASPSTPPAPATPGDPSAPAPPGTPGTPTTPAAGVAGEPVADFPDYPGATRVGYEVGGPKPTYSRSVEVKLTSADPFDKVKAHYEGILTGGGWQIVKQQVQANEAEWTARKGTSTVEIDIEQKIAGQVKISVERKEQ